MSLIVSAGALNTMQVKELCRRQLLAKTSAVTDKYQSVNTPPSLSAVVSPSPGVDDQVSRPVVEFWPMDTRPSLITWHMPAVSTVSTDMSPTPPSDSADSSEPTASQQFAAVREPNAFNCLRDNSVTCASYFSSLNGSDNNTV